MAEWEASGMEMVTEFGDKKTHPMPMIAEPNILHEAPQWILEPAGPELLKITKSYKIYESCCPDR